MSGIFINISINNTYKGELKGMLQNLKNKRQEGFTIIEVMIVLVIAAVILLIVFLAVPALQRNSRNTQAKNEAAQIMAAVGEKSGNDNAKALVASVSTSPGSDAATIMGLTKNKTITTLNVVGNATAITSTNVNSTSATLVAVAKCTVPADGTYTASGATNRQVVLIYQVENGSGTQNLCLEGSL